MVDDDAFVRDLFPRIMSEEDFEVLVAEGPDAAFELAASQIRPVDLLVSDVVMPEMKGPALFQRLRQRWPELRVLYMSGYPRGEVERQGVMEGDSFLGKPFTPLTLRAAVDAALPGGA